LKKNQRVNERYYPHTWSANKHIPYALSSSTQSQQLRATESSAKKTEPDSDDLPPPLDLPPPFEPPTSYPLHDVGQPSSLPIVTGETTLPVSRDLPSHVDEDELFLPSRGTDPSSSIVKSSNTATSTVPRVDFPPEQIHTECTHSTTTPVPTHLEKTGGLTEDVLDKCKALFELSTVTSSGGVSGKV